jgi:hypothetical protein
MLLVLKRPAFRGVWRLIASGSIIRQGLNREKAVVAPAPFMNHDTDDIEIRVHHSENYASEKGSPGHLAFGSKRKNM